MKPSQLLCTFTHKSELVAVLNQIHETYTIAYNYIYVLQNKSNLDELYITYNIDTLNKPAIPLPNTILVHRKKESNTLYTINSLNELVRSENNGVMDRNFIVDWTNYKNSIIVTNPDGIKRIPTRIFEVIDKSVKEETY
jgi:hypothetical protein